MTLVTTKEAGERLGISARQTQRLVRAGFLQAVGIDRVDFASVVELDAQRRGDHYRAWEPETAWAALALLSGQSADWLGQAQRSRLKASLRSMNGADLVARARNRASVRRLHGHPAASARLAANVVQSGSSNEVGGLAAVTGRIDGYVENRAYNTLLDNYHLEADWDGPITLRSTSFDIDIVRRIATGDAVLAAIDLAGSVDTRERSAGVSELDNALERLRG